MNHTLKNIGARATTYNDDVALKNALGGVVIRPWDHLTNLSSVGKFFFNFLNLINKIGNRRICVDRCRLQVERRCFS